MGLLLLFIFIRGEIRRALYVDHKLALCIENLYGGFLCGSAGKESAHTPRDLGSIPGWGRSPGEGKGYPLQYCSLENSMDCIVRGVAKSWTRLSDFHFHFQWMQNLNVMAHRQSISHHFLLPIQLSITAA